jgi:hypothetical protein
MKHELKLGKEDVVAQVTVERVFKTKEAAEQWALATEHQIRSRNLIAAANGSYSTEIHFWESPK